MLDRSISGSSMSVRPVGPAGQRTVHVTGTEECDHQCLQDPVHYSRGRGVGLGTALLQLRTNQSEVNTNISQLCNHGFSLPSPGALACWIKLVWNQINSCNVLFQSQTNHRNCFWGQTDPPPLLCCLQHTEGLHHILLMDCLVKKNWIIRNKNTLLDASVSLIKLCCVMSPAAAEACRCHHVTVRHQSRWLVMLTCFCCDSCRISFIRDPFKSPCFCVQQKGHLVTTVGTGGL